MEREFNITGTCFPESHFMADISGKLQQTIELVRKGKYFAINRPRQFGKTTMLETLSRKLREKPDEWLVFNISFEGIGSNVFKEEGSFCQTFLELLEQQMVEGDAYELAAFLKLQAQEVSSLKQLSKDITALANKAADRKLVLLIDEVDKSSNNQLFLDFLGMLRNKYLNRNRKTDRTFHAVILAGLHDIKTLKAKIRPDNEAKYNSPWNIAADYDVDLSFQPAEIVPMLEDYAQERGVKMDAPAIAERLFYYTSGYPFLVSALCKILDEKMLPEKSERTWTVEDIETAADRLIKSERSNTNFDTLIKNLENDKGLYDLAYSIAIDNEIIPYNPHAPLVNLAFLHGIVRNGQGLQIHNRIYREVIVNYMTVKMLTEDNPLEIEQMDPYLLPGNALNLEKVLLKFQEYMREQYSKKDTDFLERSGRLIFLAFLKPIINGKGYAFKEPEISEERRLDIAVTFFQHKYVVELKIWRGETAHEKGLSQLSAYLDRQHLDEGYLVIFDRSANKSWANAWLDVAGKRVFAIWV